jgi:hypothetical protein
MKTFVVLTVSIVLVSILFCPIVMAAPSMPADLQMVQPDPSLPKELSAFFGKWEGTGIGSVFLIVEKIDEEKASLYYYRGPGGPPDVVTGWIRYEANVSKVRGKYKLSFQDRLGQAEITLKGEYLNIDSKFGGTRLKRVQ